MGSKYSVFRNEPLFRLEYQFDSLSIVIITLLLSLFIVSPVSAKPEVLPNTSIIKVRVSGFTGGMEDYETGLITLAAQSTQKAFGDFKVKTIKSRYSLARYISLMQESDDLHIAVSSTNIPKKELDNIIKLPLPVLENSLGLRSTIVKKQFLSQFHAINSFSDFKRLSIGQVSGWPDSAIYKHNQFPLIEGNKEANLYAMLTAGRFDILPVNFLKVSTGLPKQHKKHSELLSVSHTYIYYPIRVWAYISGRNKTIAQRLTTGLTNIFSDGSARSLFFSLYEQEIKKLNAKDSIIYALENPTYTEVENRQIIHNFIEEFNLKDKVYFEPEDESL